MVDQDIIWRLSRFAEGEHAKTVYALPPNGSYDPLRRDISALLAALSAPAQPVSKADELAPAEGGVELGVDTPSAEESGSQPGWRPIETAPKVNAMERILVVTAGRVREAYWGLGPYDRRAKEYVRQWVGGPNEWFRDVTAWMPMPAAPMPAEARSEQAEGGL